MIFIAGGAVVLVAVVALVAYLLWGRTSPAPTATKSTTTTAPPPPPVPVAALDELLLTPDQISSAMGTAGLSAKNTSTRLVDDATSIAQPECRTVNDSLDASAYNGSGWTALRRQQLQQPLEGEHIDYFVDQGVAAFPAAETAAAFFAASTKRWAACANRNFVVTVSNGGFTWTVGPLSNVDGTLSIVDTQEGANGYACQRALTVSNNVAVDINTCSRNVGDTAVNIAHLIAAKVSKL